MRLFVTGICGRLGRAVAEEAAERGIGIRGLDIVEWPQKKPRPAGVECHRGSYEDVALLRQLLPGCDGIIHTGGPHGGNINQLSTADFIEAHNASVARMLDLAMECGIGGVALSSTMEVQIGREWSASGAAFVDEDSPARCDSRYSLSRRLMEVLGQEYSRIHGLSIASLRYMAFGYSDDTKAGPNLLARTVPARDVAAACILAATRTDLQGDIFNIGPQTPITPDDIGLAVSGKEAQVLDRHYPGASALLESLGIPLRATHFWPVTSIRKAGLILGWKPRYTFETWLRENGWQPAGGAAADHAAPR